MFSRVRKKELCAEELGQASVEAMLLFAVVLLICTTLFLFFSKSTDGTIQTHHIEASSHTLEYKPAEGVQDVLLY